ncbi:MAG: hypothetical protein HRT61_18735, partial [Ekhidna sp.]|nr:hypothetical protein [Ekhidna sp.]
MRSVVLLTLLLTALSGYTQERCASIAPQSGEFENWLRLKISQNRKAAHRHQAAIVQIPVVVHVFHKGESIGSGVNLSTERIRAQIDSLTADFRRNNADTINTPSEFSSITADIEIEFVLAKQDPAGNPTNGIVRLQGSRNVYRANSHRPLLRSESFWPASNYLNMYVLDLQSFLGYASFPTVSLNGNINTTEDLTFDGVLIDYQYFGVNPSAPSFESRGRTTTHEVGHYLGLRHIWGDGNCSADDFVEDTPLADDDNGGYTSPCSFPNVTDDEVCVDGEPEMFQNFMDYTDDICMNLFTQGQKYRMRAVMDNALNRLSLTNSPGLEEPQRSTVDLAITGILGPDEAVCTTNISPVLSIANHGTDEITSFNIQLYLNEMAQGSPVSFLSSLLPLETEVVNFGTFSVPSAPYTISFEVTEVNETADRNPNNNTFTKTISSNQTQELPFSVNFESSSTILGNVGEEFPWEITTAPFQSTDNQALVFKSHENEEWFGSNTILRTPIFDLQDIQSGELRFSYAHAISPNSFYDGLMVKASIDCGETFKDVLFSSFGTRLATAATTSSAFLPANPLDWVDTLVSITDYRGIDGVQFAFVGINGSGNNIYIDNIELEETNLLANDIRPQSFSGPIVTCAEATVLELRIRNVGAEDVNSFEVKYYINGDTAVEQFDRLAISSKDYATFFIRTDNLLEGRNDIGAEITLVNGIADESVVNNSLESTFFRNLQKDDYPLLVDFSVADAWDITGEIDTLWQRDAVDDRQFLKANGFNAPNLGAKGFFISPSLSTGNLDSAKLSFRVSYASRTGFNDQLQVLLSTDCGENYTTSLLEAFSDSLATTSSTSRWVPSSDQDWKTFEIDLPHAFPDENIKVAFVFIPGGGNDLYLDDISITEGTPPTYEEIMRV